MLPGFDPLILFSIMLLQIANRYMKINITKAQEKLINHPYSQIIMYFCIIYFATRNVFNTVIIVIVSYVFMNILFNENNKHNIFSKSWLYKENLINEPLPSYKDEYKNNIKNLHL